MTKNPPKSMAACGELECYDLRSQIIPPNTSQQKTNLPDEKEGSETARAMPLSNILKIAELSRKYGPLFYQDSLTFESLDIPMSNLRVTPRHGLKDNLCMISGVNEKIEQKINQLGIWHYDQIISMTDIEIIWFEKKMNFKRGYFQINNWKGQCQKLQLGYNSVDRPNEEAER